VGDFSFSRHLASFEYNLISFYISLINSNRTCSLISLSFRTDLASAEWLPHTTFLTMLLAVFFSTTNSEIFPERGYPKKTYRIKGEKN